MIKNKLEQLAPPGSKVTYGARYYLLLMLTGDIWAAFNVLRRMTNYILTYKEYAPQVGPEEPIFYQMLTKPRFYDYTTVFHPAILGNLIVACIFAFFCWRYLSKTHANYILKRLPDKKAYFRKLWGLPLAVAAILLAIRCVLWLICLITYCAEMVLLLGENPILPTIREVLL